MTTDFSRILSLLRKEKSIPQKQAAAHLGISQALLSHYEKGIREPGLDFILRCSEYYGVTCDYLLGRSPQRDQGDVDIDAIYDQLEDEKKENSFNQGMYSILNRKLYVNAVAVLYDVLGRCPERELVDAVSGYFYVCFYNMYRHLYEAGSNPKGSFAADELTYDLLCKSAALKFEADIKTQLSGRQFDLTHDTVKKLYPKFAASLFNLLHTAEEKLKG